MPDNRDTHKAVQPTLEELFEEVENIDLRKQRNPSDTSIGIEEEQLDQGGLVELEEEEFGEIVPMSEEELDELVFYSIKTGNPATVESISNIDNPIEILQLNRFRDELEDGQIIFIVFGGDKGRPEVTWETGLIGIGHVARGPYDIGYEGRNFKLQINVDILLENNIKKEDLVPYITTYNLPGISPMTKGEPNQALSAIYGQQAVGLVRAILDTYPDLEEELTAIFGERFMANVKGEIPYLIEQRLSFEDRQRQEEEEEEQILTPTIYSSIYDPDVDRIKGSLEMEISPIEHFRNFINIGKNIILTGPPGTGKTTIAERAAEEGVRTNYIDGYILSTATDDWSTFDTIGGYMPDPNDSGKLKFHEGLVLKSIEQNKWLIIDELNRADIDKAFGQLFTVLSGKDVELPFKSNNQTIKIKHHNKENSYYDSSTSTYYIGQNWRVIGTMNTFDKNSLFALSYAFMRRFAFIEIPIPNLSYYSRLINSNADLSQGNKDFVYKLVEVTPKPLGPAIIIELMEYLKITNNSGRIEAICGTVIPQYEGLDHKEIHDFYQQIGLFLSMQEREMLKRFIYDFFDLPSNFFRNADRRLMLNDPDESVEEDDSELDSELDDEESEESDTDDTTTEL
ncbi:ATPase associated with various cellular activities AAA_5 [Bacillus methanolicus PB1]|uniref:ATPase associated with various cellular activities AAA_5 n=1 Tax=Bacillus methanolicus PB1 TaxID=997296 RepID=I3E5N4_BACMT|nr:AAA family ATPase [Bacillus methanolicus]EIJ81805.1 ATPase associated with various cellular activities AAA_5 [Bacillus methanolicus PB1]